MEWSLLLICGIQLGPVSFLCSCICFSRMNQQRIGHRRLRLCSKNNAERKKFSLKHSTLPVSIPLSDAISVFKISLPIDLLSFNISLPVEAFHNNNNTITTSCLSRTHLISCYFVIITLLNTCFFNYSCHYHVETLCCAGMLLTVYMFAFIIMYCSYSQQMSSILLHFACSQLICGACGVSVHYTWCQGFSE